MTLRMTDFSARDYAVFPYLSMRDGRGLYRSRHGLVDVLVSPKRRSGTYRFSGHTSLTIIRDGRSYHRSWDREWPPLTIARLAREFAAHVAGAAS